MKTPKKLYIIDYQLLPCEIDGIADARINAMPFNTTNGKLIEYINLNEIWNEGTTLPLDNSDCLFELTRLTDGKKYHILLSYDKDKFNLVVNGNKYKINRWLYLKDIL